MNMQEEFERLKAIGSGTAEDADTKQVALDEEIRIRCALLQAAAGARSHMRPYAPRQSSRHDRRKGAWQARKATQQQAKRDRKAQKRGGR